MKFQFWLNSDISSYLRNFFCAALSLTVEIIPDLFPSDGDVFDQNNERFSFSGKHREPAAGNCDDYSRQQINFEPQFAP